MIIILFFNNNNNLLLIKKTAIKTYLQLISLKKKEKNSQKALFANHFIWFRFKKKLIQIFIRIKNILFQ